MPRLVVPSDSSAHRRQSGQTCQVKSQNCARHWRHVTKDSSFSTNAAVPVFWILSLCPSAVQDSRLSSLEPALWLSSDHLHWVSLSFLPSKGGHSQGHGPANPSSPLPWARISLSPAASLPQPPLLATHGLSLNSAFIAYGQGTFRLQW